MYVWLPPCYISIIGNTFAFPLLFHAKVAALKKTWEWWELVEVWAAFVRIWRHTSDNNRGEAHIKVATGWNGNSRNHTALFQLLFLLQSFSFSLLLSPNKSRMAATDIVLPPSLFMSASIFHYIITKTDILYMQEGIIKGALMKLRVSSWAGI